MAERTHKPTLKKLRDARNRGEVVRGRDVVALGSFVGLWILLGFGAAYFSRHLNHIVERSTLATDPTQGGAEAAWLPQLQSMAQDFFWILASLLCLCCGCAVWIGLLQTRGAISVDPTIPECERVSPVQGLRKLLSTRQLLELAKMLLKSSALIGMLACCLVISSDTLGKMVHARVPEILPISGSLVSHLMGWAVVIYAVGAVLDYAHQFHEFTKRQKMSLEEPRHDLGEREGDPLVEGRGRAIAKEVFLSDRISSASVVVVNPTHVAVALRYTPGETPLPLVVVKGLDDRAQDILAQAEQHGVPILEDPPLARKLFRETALDHYINDELVDIVAAVFSWARQVDRRPVQPTSRSSTRKPIPRTV